MSILFFFDSPIIPHIGGVQRVTDILTLEFVKRGHNVIFLCSRDSYDNETEYKYVAPQYFVDFKKTTVKEDIKQIIDKYNIDLIINQFTFNNLRNSILLFGCVDERVKKISCFHNDPFHFLNKERRMEISKSPHGIIPILMKYLTILFPVIYRTLKLRKHKKHFAAISSISDKFCLLSDRFISEYTSIMKLNINKSTKICSINNPNTFDCSTEMEDKQEKQKIILYVGRLKNPQKRPLDFIKMWKILSTENPDWRAVVIGDGDEYHRLKKYINNNQIPRIELAGNQKNVSKFYDTATFVCLTSNHEGWGMVLGEGMAKGCIPVAYDTYSSVHDIIDDGKNGIVSYAFSPLNMADRINAIICDDILRLKLSKAAQQKISNFTVERIVNQWEELIGSITK